MVQFNFYKTFWESIAKGEIILNTDTFKLVLSNTAPDQSTDKTLSDVAEVTAGNGYTSGGISLTPTRGYSGDVWVLDFADVTLTASGGSISTWRYRILMSSTGNRVVGWWDEGGAVTIADGGSFPINFDADGVIRMGEGVV